MHRPAHRSTHRAVVPLQSGHLTAFPEHVVDCLSWQLPTRFRGTSAQAAARKAAWVEGVQEHWGVCGMVVCRGEEPVALALYAPAAWLAGVGARPTAPASPDAVVLTSPYVRPDQRGRGLARMLVQVVARDLVRRPTPPVAVETFAGIGPCLLPVDFWTRVGFAVDRQHPVNPRMRMDLRMTARARAEAALGKLAGAVQPRPMAAPEAPLGRGARDLSRAGRTAP